MPAKKGTRPPNAGKRGRKPGTPNKVTRTTRDLFSAFVDRNAEKAQALFDRVSRKNPAMALRILSNFAEFTLPRLQRTELDASISAGRGPIEIDLHSMSAVDAAHAYQQLMQIGKRGQNPNVQFRPTPPTLPAPAPAVVTGPPELPPSAAARGEPTRSKARAEPTEAVQEPTSPAARTADQEYIPADDPAPSPMSRQTRELWERLGKPANPAEGIAALDALLRNQRPPRIVT